MFLLFVFTGGRNDEQMAEWLGRRSKRRREKEQKDKEKRRKKREKSWRMGMEREKGMEKERLTRRRR